MPFASQKSPDTHYSMPSEAEWWFQFQEGITHPTRDPVRGAAWTVVGRTVPPVFDAGLNTYQDTVALERPRIDLRMGIAYCDSLYQEHLSAIGKKLNELLTSARDAWLKRTHETATTSFEARPSRDAFAFALSATSSIDQEPVEDGYEHPAEQILERALAEHPGDMIRWLQFLVSDEKNSSMVASVLKCVGRLNEGSCPQWGYDLARKALEHRDVEVRDAGAQMLELCETSEAASMLRSHEETVPWLRDYIRRVITEIERR